MWLIIINWKEIETAPWYEAQVSRISQNFQMWLVWRSFNCKDELENHKAAGCAKQCVCKACNVDYLYLDERLGHEFQFFFMKMKPSPKKTDKYFSHWSYSLWKCNLKYPNICFQTWWAQISGLFWKIWPTRPQNTRWTSNKLSGKWCYQIQDPRIHV